MAFLDEEFSVDTLPKGTSNFEPLPEGWYNATITGAEVKETKAGDGKYIACKYTVTGPSHQGRVVFGNLNIKNASTKAEEIGRQQLGEIMRAIGLGKVSDTDQLIGGNLGIKLSVKTGEYAGNEIKGYRALSNPAQGVIFKASAPVAALAKAAPPWAKK
jgi:flagellar hook assembly protein FlgD